VAKVTSSRKKDNKKTATAVTATAIQLHNNFMNKDIIA